MEREEEKQSKTVVEKMLAEVLSKIAALEQLLKEHGLQKKDVLNAKEAMQFLGIKASTLYKLTYSKVVSYFKRGKLLYFKRSELERHLTEFRVKSKKELVSEAVTRSLKH